MILPVVLTEINLSSHLKWQKPDEMELISKYEIKPVHLNGYLACSDPISKSMASSSRLGTMLVILSAPRLQDLQAKVMGNNITLNSKISLGGFLADLCRR